MGIGNERAGFLDPSGEVAQLVGHLFADRKIGSSSPGLPTVLRMRGYSKILAATRFTQPSVQETVQEG